MGNRTIVERPPLLPRGYKKIGTSVTYDSNGWSSWFSMSDVVGNRNAMNPFSLERVTIERCPTYTGKFGSFTEHYGTRPSCVTTGLRAGSHTLVYPRSILEAIADSHPGEPTISIPNFVYELKDLPEMFKTYLRHVRDYGPRPGKRRTPPATATAEQWLAYNFCLAPLVSDLKSIYDVAEGVSRQAKRYHKARTMGYVATRGMRGEATNIVVNNNFSFDGSFGGVYATKVVNVSGKAWTCTHWKATDALPLYALIKGGNRNLLLDQLGLDLSFETVWNAIPWSWLVDWVTDASSILKIYSNVGGFSFYRACAMETVKEDVLLTPKTQQKYYSSDGGSAAVVYKTEKKSRSLINPSIRDATINIFNGRQLSILASLLIANKHGRSIAKVN